MYEVNGYLPFLKYNLLEKKGNLGWMASYD